MGSLVSLIVANLYMDHFEGEALRFASHLPGFCIGSLMILGSSSNRLISNFFWII